LNAPNLRFFPIESDFNEKSLQDEVSAYPPRLFNDSVLGWTVFDNIIADPVPGIEMVSDTAHTMIIFPIFSEQEPFFQTKPDPRRRRLEYAQAFRKNNLD